MNTPRWHYGNLKVYGDVDRYMFRNAGNPNQVASIYLKSRPGHQTPPSHTLINVVLTDLSKHGPDSLVTLPLHLACAWLLSNIDEPPAVDTMFGNLNSLMEYRYWIMSRSTIHLLLLGPQPIPEVAIISHPHLQIGHPHDPEVGWHQVVIREYTHRNGRPEYGESVVNPETLSYLYEAFSPALLTALLRHRMQAKDTYGSHRFPMHIEDAKRYLTVEKETDQ